MSNAYTIYIVTINSIGTVFSLLKSISSSVLVAYDLATHVSIFNTVYLKHAASAGACVHAAAGDAAAGDGERGMLAGDVVAALRPLVDRL